MLKDSNSDEKKFCEFYSIANLEDVTNEQFLSMMKTLERKIEDNKKKQKTNNNEELPNI
jgi:hypothetical protein